MTIHKSRSLQPARTGLATTLISRARWARTEYREVLIVAFASAIGVAAGACVVLMTVLSHLLTTSAGTISLHYSHGKDMFFFAGPVIGAIAILALSPYVRRRPMVDPLEANALHGGKMSWRDAGVIAAQTILSNGTGASVGLEAAYAQCGATFGSKCATALRLRRSDIRILVASGTAAAISAAFGAPIAGMFYACELVLGAYSVPIAGAVLSASISGAITARLMGMEAYRILPPVERMDDLIEYGAAVGMALVCSIAAIALMWLVVKAEALAVLHVRASHRLLCGGVALGFLIALTPTAMGSGHEALHALFVTVPASWIVMSLLAAKVLASTITLATGFRGGLFFASLYLGALTGAAIWAACAPFGPIDPTFLMLIGMAGFASGVLGTPLAIAFLVLEATGTFSLIGPVLVVSAASNVIVRQFFGFSYSTWRLHLRGEAIDSAMDIGWQREIHAGDLMLVEPRSTFADISIADFRARHPLGSSVNTIVLTDVYGYYKGLVYVPVAHETRHDQEAASRTIGEIATQAEYRIDRHASILEAMRLFRQFGLETIAVTDSATGKLAGLLREASVVRRYAAEVERALAH